MGDGGAKVDLALVEIGTRSVLEALARHDVSGLGCRPLVRNPEASDFS